MKPRHMIGFLVLFIATGIAWYFSGYVSEPAWLNWLMVGVCGSVGGLCSTVAFRWCERAFDQGYSAGIAAEKAKQIQYVEQMQEPPNDGDLLR